jgi:hypothetical protein
MANLSVFLKVKALNHNIIVIDAVFPYAGKLVNLGFIEKRKQWIINKGKRLIVYKSI